MRDIREALLEVEDMRDLSGWSYEDVAYQEIGDPFSLHWGDYELNPSQLTSISSRTPDASGTLAKVGSVKCLPDPFFHSHRSNSHGIEA